MVVMADSFKEKNKSERRMDRGFPCQKNMLTEMFTVYVDMANI